MPLAARIITNAPRSLSALLSAPVAMPLVVAVVVLGVGAFSASVFADSDTWWHIAAGQSTLAHGAVPGVDPFSFTMPGAPWTAHEWLSEVFLALAYQAAGLSGVAPKKVVVTGGNGFIGKHVVEHIRAIGWAPVAPASQDWRLGGPLPPSCDEADAVIHLASAALNARTNLRAASTLDIDGTRLLLEQHRALKTAGKRKKFIFVSSQSARKDAVNSYGKSKWAAECLLDQEDEIVVRPGLVYGSESSGVFGLFASLVESPVVPVLSRTPCIQPIEVHELADALLRIAATEQPLRLYELGAIAPLSFTEMILAVARHMGRAPPLRLPFPALPVRLAARLLDFGLGQSPSLLERIDGLLALRPMDTENSLKALGITLADFAERSA
jgi:nucleoside-diphosphate-sugar epimerase